MDLFWRYQVKNRTHLKLIILGILLIPVDAYAATVSRITTFSDGSILTASQLNAEFDNVVDNMNALTNDNISTSAAISPSKISSAIKGSGLTRNASTGALSVTVDGTSIQISSDTLIVKDAGITGAKLSPAIVDDSSIELNSNILQVKDDGITTDKILDANVTREKMESVGQQISGSSGVFNITNTSFVDVTNLSVSLTTNGRPVMLLIVPAAAAANCNVYTNTSSSISFRALRDATDLGQFFYEVSPGSQGCSMIWFDTPAAGTYTYKIQARKSGSGAGGLLNTAKLIAYEL